VTHWPHIHGLVASTGSWLRAIESVSSSGPCAWKHILSLPCHIGFLSDIFDMSCTLRSCHLFWKIRKPGQVGELKSGKTGEKSESRGEFVGFVGENWL